MIGKLSPYYDDDRVAEVIARGDHRAIIGGMWEEVGGLQLAFLTQQGMQPHHRLLDIGCGALRLGVKAVQYLQPGNYWGTDLRADLLQVGYDTELAAGGLADRLPRHQLVEDAEFSFAGVTGPFDYAIATSVFTHLPLNYLRVCFANLAEKMTVDGRFYFTIFVPTGAPYRPSQQCATVVTNPARDPFHVCFADVCQMAVATPWQLDFIGDWNHPRNQKMVRAVRI